MKTRSLFQDCIWVIGLLFVSIFTYGQANKFSLSLSDSLKLRVFVDSINHSDLFSVRRQLYIDSALMIKPWSAFWWQQKSMPLDKQKKYELAKPYLDSAVKYNRSKYLDYRGFVNCIFRKNYSDAISDFKAAQKEYGYRHVMDHSYDFWLGLSYLQLNKFDSSIMYFTNTIKIEQESRSDSLAHFLNWFYLGIAWYEKDNNTMAIYCFDKCLEQYRSFSDAKYYKAYCLTRINKKAEAKTLIVEADADFKKGYTINEDNVIYESYPYQINQRFYLDNALKWMGKE